MPGKEESRDRQQSASVGQNTNAQGTDTTRDPEFEIPDPEEVKRDIEQAEKIYGSDEGKQRPESEDKVA